MCERNPRCGVCVCVVETGNKREGGHAAKEPTFPQRVLGAERPEKRLERPWFVITVSERHGVWWPMGRERKGRWQREELVLDTPAV